MFATRIVSALVLTAASTLASAQVGTFQCGGNVYEIVAAQGITWDQAKALAETRHFGVVQGRLASITHPTEDACIAARNNPPSGTRTQLWVGGREDSEGAWHWLNGGLILPENHLVDDGDPPRPFTRVDPYTNWALLEPDNSNSAMHVSVGPDANGLHVWWDNGKPNNTIWGIVVEYGDSQSPFPAALCLNGCPLTESEEDGSILTLPATAGNTGGQYDVKTWVIEDDPLRCGKEVLGSPFGEPKLLNLVGDSTTDLKIPGWLCAKPSLTNPDVGHFIVIKTNSAVQVLTGTVAVETFTENLLKQHLPFPYSEEPLETLAYPCNSPPFAGGVDPSHQDVGVFQTDDLAKMVELEAAENTIGCGSIRLKGGKGSWWVFGLNINFGSDDIYTGFLALTLHKLQIMEQAVQNAASAPENVIAKGDASKLLQEVRTAEGDLANGNELEAKKHILNFLKFARAAKYKASPSGANWPGEFESRGENALLTIDKLSAAENFVAQ